MIARRASLPKTLPNALDGVGKPSFELILRTGRADEFDSRARSFRPYSQSRGQHLGKVRTQAAPMTVNEDAALLPIDEAAAKLGTTARFLRRLVAERRIPYFKIGRHLRFRVADLDSFIAAGRVEARR